MVRITDLRNECSGAGGEHYTLQLDEPGNAPRLVHAGGHGIYLRLDGAGPLGGEQDLGPGRWALGGVYFVAEVALRDPPYDARPDAPGWCLSGLPAYAGGVRRLLPARGPADARRRLAEIAMLGVAPPTTTFDSWIPTLPSQ